MNNRLDNKMQAEYDAILHDCRTLTEIELEKNDPNWKSYTRFILGNIYSFRRDFEHQARFNDIFSELQKKVAVLVNQVADHCKLPKSREINLQ